MTTQPIFIKGKPYIQVAGRVTLAHEDAGFSMLASEPFSIADRHFVRVTIVVKDKQYIGTSEIKFGARPGTADGDSPIECAETSALGRALGYAGYGSVESLASADEVLRNEQQSQVSDVDELRAIMQECKSLGLAATRDEWASWKRSVLGADVSPKQMSHDHVTLLRHSLEDYKLAGVPASPAA